jgi:hypothetical protein
VFPVEKVWSGGVRRKKYRLGALFSGVRPPSEGLCQEKIINEVVGWTGSELVDSSDLLDGAMVENGDAVGEEGGFLLVVGDEQGREFADRLKFLQPLTQFPAYFGIEGAEGFVQEQDTGVGGQSPCEGNTLPLASGDLLREAATEAFELDLLEELKN